jgi:hypothetical protein
MIDFLTRNWGNLASIAGLFFSILAFIFSKRASKAARQARDAVLRRSLSEEMNGANRTAGEIVTYVGLERGDMALIRAGELMTQTSYLVARWDNKLTEGSKNNLLSMREQLRSIHEVLTKGPMSALTPKAKMQLAQTCQRVNATYSEEYGRAVRASEDEVE